MFNVANARHRFAFKKHALGDRGSGEFDASVERVQVSANATPADIPQPALCESGITRHAAISACAGLYCFESLGEKAEGRRLHADPPGSQSWRAQ
jgi:hypothetical protein